MIIIGPILMRKLKQRNLVTYLMSHSYKVECWNMGLVKFSLIPILLFCFLSYEYNT